MLCRYTVSCTVTPHEAVHGGLLAILCFRTVRQVVPAGKNCGRLTCIVLSKGAAELRQLYSACGFNEPLECSYGGPGSMVTAVMHTIELRLKHRVELCAAVFQSGNQH